MKKILFLVTLCALSLVSCNRRMTYTISGSFDIPEEIDFGDTVIIRDPLDGMIVYMYDFNGETVDSAVVENDKFEFSGKIARDESFFVYLACDYSYGIVAIEPGDIGVTIGREVLAFGTPTNDAINDIDTRVGELAMEFNEKMTMAMEGYNQELVDSLIRSVYMEFNQRCLELLDSVYLDNQDNLIGEYVEGIRNSILNAKDGANEQEDF